MIEKTSIMYFNLLFIFFNLMNIFFIKIGIVEGIAGGHVAQSGQFKYQVVIQSDGLYPCGGAIISDYHILTAAHCMLNKENKFKNSKFAVIGGVIDVKEKSRYKIKVDVEKAYVPRQFVFSDSSLTAYDIAVLKLKSSLEVKNNPALSILSLPRTIESYETTEPIISGFGATSLKIKYDNETVTLKPIRKIIKLKFAYVHIIPNNECATTYGYSIHDSHICAQVKKRDSNPQGVCRGDSGGSLVLNGNTTIGVLSSGSITCDESYEPGVYTRVTYFLDFIHKALRDESSPNMRIAINKIHNKCLGLCKTEGLEEMFTM